MSAEIGGALSINGNSNISISNCIF